jgi:hypothetical protein
MLFVMLCTLKNLHGIFETRVHVFLFIYRAKMLNSVQMLKWKSDKKSKQNNKETKQDKSKTKTKTKTKAKTRQK